MTIAEPWSAEVGTNKVVFLLDANSKIERAILQQRIGEESAAAVECQWLALDLRSETAAADNVKAIDAVLNGSEGLYFIPLRVVWISSRTAAENNLSFKALLFGHEDNPGLIRQRLIYKRNPAPYTITFGKGASLSELKARISDSGSDVGIARFIAKSALLALERSERNMKGSRYKIPRMLEDEVIGKPQLLEALQGLSDKSGTSMESLLAEASACLREMAATPTPRGLHLAAALGRFMYTRGFDPNIDFASGDLDRVRSLLGDRPVAFLFTHKSHIDGFLLITLFHDMNLTPVHTFGGINMGFLGLGTLLRKAGAIFIRRSFQGAEVYKLVFKNYIDYLGEKRFPVMWALEGTRSRTGKLMPPKFGLINYVVDAHMRDDAADLVLMPISIVYDQVPEVSDYDLIQSGGKKRPESVSWFMQYIQRLKKPHGKIHVRFGQGIQLNNYLENLPNAKAVDRAALQKIAFDLAVDVNKATPITLSSLITYVLLEYGHRAITLQQLQLELDKLRTFIDLFNFPMTQDAANISAAMLERVLQQLAATGVLSIATEGIEVLYMIPFEAGRRAAYYRNGLVQFFITSAIGELALVSVTAEAEAAMEQFHSEALRIRDLLKYEFFFEGSEAFLESLEAEFDTRAPQWRASLAQGSTAIQELLRSLEVTLGHGTLRPFLEGYLVFARALSIASNSEALDPKLVIARSLALGKQRVLQQRIHCEESVSQSYFENAVKIAESRKLFEKSDEVTLAAGRLAFLEELRAVTANVRIVASIAETKRLSERVAREKSQLS